MRRRCGPPTRFWDAQYVLGCLAAACLAGVPAQGQCQYDVTIIQAPICPPPLPEPPATFPTGLNELGKVVGYYRQCDDPTLREAYVWTPATGMATLDRPPAFVGAQGNDINDSGDVVGSARLSNNRFRAVLWQDGRLVDLGTMPGGNSSEAHALNSRTQIVGHWTNTVRGPFRAFLWENGVMADLNLPLGPNSDAKSINEAGQITGWMGTSFLIDSHAFVWGNGRVIDLRVVAGGFTSTGESINSTQQVAGWGQVPAEGFPFGINRAFLWQDGQMLALGLLPGFDRCAALAINDAHQIVGICSEAANPNNQVPFIYENGVMQDLTQLIADAAGLQLLRNVSSMNNAGQITGWGIGPDGHVVAVLLTPVGSSPADIDNNCVVDVQDLFALLPCFGQAGDPPCNLADINHDGAVNVLDLIVLLLDWG